MQLVAYGAQDVYLTGSPQITFFKVVYRRHTNFAMESMEQTLNGNASFGSKVVCRIARNGDLVGACYVEVNLPAGDDSTNDDWCNRVGFRLLKQVELRIGGQMIDRQTGLWMHVWSELTHSDEQKRLLDSLVGESNANGDPAGSKKNDEETKLFIPLMFSFCRNPGLALPLIALQYHEVELHIEFSTLAECKSSAGSADPFSNNKVLGNVTVWCDYIFLDTEERRDFAQEPHEYLIETVQNQEHSISGTSTNSLRLNFNHPCKELMWVAQKDSNSGDQFTDFTNDASSSAAGSVGMVEEAKLLLNGQDRFAARGDVYFNRVQPYQHHTGCPDLGVYCYSFALKPEEHQPSGTCNFSRIDNANLNVKCKGTCKLTVMAHCYNVLRCASGMGGLAYSN